MSLRAALHQCADILADALEREAAQAPATPTKRRKIRERPPVPPIRTDAPPDVVEKATYQLRKAGLL